MHIVHEGRGGYIEIGGRRYPIEHVGEGRFAIHVLASAPPDDVVAVEALVAREPATWVIERAPRGRRSIRSDR